MKKELFIFILIMLISIIACNNNTKYYEKPIENWLSKNLNDFSSYEPIEFTILNSNLDFVEYINLFGFENVLQRKIDITYSLIEELEKIESIDNTEITKMSECLKKLSAFDLQLEIPVNLIDSINVILDKTTEAQMKSISTVKEMRLLEIYAQYESVSFRYQRELSHLKQELQSLGSDIETFRMDIEKGLFINHKFRAKNSFGALIINSILFKLDNKKEKVIKAIDKK